MKLLQRSWFGYAMGRHGRLDADWSGRSLKYNSVRTPDLYLKPVYCNPVRSQNAVSVQSRENIVWVDEM